MHSWEMSTIGHPLSDISNLLTPYFTARLDPRRSVNVHPGFLPRATRGLPTPDEITTLYFSIVDAPRSNSSSFSSSSSSPSSASADPSISLELSLATPSNARTAAGGEADRRRELQWAQAFNIFRLAAICQGIAARHAGRQASSEQARRYGDARGPLAEFAWELVQYARSSSPARRLAGGGSGSGSGGGGSGTGSGIGGGGSGGGGDGGRDDDGGAFGGVGQGLGSGRGQGRGRILSKL